MKEQRPQFFGEERKIIDRGNEEEIRQRIPLFEQERIDPIENCKHAEWNDVRAMWMCLECKVGQPP